MAKAKEGSVVEVHYTGKLDDGEVFDSSKGREPLKFTIDEGMVIAGFNDAIKGMEVGEKKEVKIEAKDAYGEKNPDLVQKIPKERFGDNEVKEGMVMAFRSPHVEQDIPAKILEIGDKEITIDINPPLAGQDLNFEIELVNIE